MIGYFSVKNFERFQHYKDRSPPWIKLYGELLEDYDFGALPDAAKGHLLAIWLLASRMGNKLPYNPVWIGNKINATEAVDLNLLSDAGFIVPFDVEASRGKLEDWSSRYISDAVRQELLDEAGHKCAQCPSSVHLEIDHIIPVSRGGTGEKPNLQVLCRSCNRKKRAKLTYASSEQAATQLRKPEREVETEKEKKDLSDKSDPSKPEPKPEKRKAPYPEAFEAFWREYPTDALMSKKAAFAQWQRLDQPSRDAAKAAIPAFKAYCQKNTTYRPVHAQRFLSDRRFDGFNAAPADTFQNTDERGWRDRMRVWRERQGWAAKWGPKPGEPSCKCPQNILDEGKSQ